jgi:glycosyltransferase involved in cell wall biosynthesis
MIKEYPEISSILAEDLTPSLEVFVLTWNRLEYLKQTLNSLLNSTVSNFKITVVDNASDDGTSNYLQDLQNQNPRIRHIRIPEHFNSNIDSMVKAISEITADYAMIFHDDDIIHCQYIELAQHILKNYNNIDIICTGANRFSKEFQIKQNLCKKFHLRVFSSKLNFAEMVFINKLGKDLCYPNIIYRRENLVKSVKHFVFSDFGKISDRPFVLETVQNGQAVFIEEQMINYRVHEKQDSATNSNGPYDNEIINLLKYFKQILQEKWYSYFIYTVHSYYWLKSLNKWGYLDRPLNIIAKKAFEAGVINKYTYNLCSSSFAPILSKLNYAFKKLFIMAEYKKQIIQFNNKQS